MQVDELYQEIILDHYRSPRNKHRCEQCMVTVSQDNPMCGDEITLDLSLDEGKIGKIAFEGQGCSISQASASMMTEAVKGLSVAQVRELIEMMREMMHGEISAAEEEELGDLAAFEGVSKFPVRVKCALLCWMALKEALAKTEQQGAEQ